MLCFSRNYTFRFFFLNLKLNFRCSRDPFACAVHRVWMSVASCSLQELRAGGAVCKQVYKKTTWRRSLEGKSCSQQILTSTQTTLRIQTQFCLLLCVSLFSIYIKPYLIKRAAYDNFPPNIICWILSWNI